MKKFKLFALTALLALGTNAFADVVEDGRSVNGVLYQLSKETTGDVTTYTAQVTGFAKTATDAQKKTVSIPATVTGDNAVDYKVTSFKSGWTAANDKLESLTIDVTNFAKDDFNANIFTGLDAVKTIKITDTTAAKDAKVKAFPASAISATAKGKLESVDLSGSNINELAASAFNGCTKLAAFDLTKITKIGESAFQGCTAITALTLPAGITSVGDNAFKGMTELATVTINISNDDLKTIGAWFSGDSKIASLTISSAKLEEIASGAFADAIITTLDLSKATALKTVANDSFKNNKYTSVKLGGTKLTAIPTSLTSGAAGSLVEITLPTAAGYTTIADKQFEDFTKLTTVTIGENVTAIGNLAFKGATALVGITLPEKLETIGQEAFAGCTKLAKIDIPATVTAIAKQAFNGCTALAEVTGMEGVTAINNWVFRNCEKLASVPMPNVTSIGAQAFANTIISEINAPKVTSIAASWFGTRDANSEANTTLKSVVLGAAPIAANTFANFTALQSVSLVQGAAGDDVVANAFYGCTGLRTFKYDANSGIAGVVENLAFAACSNSPLIKFETSSVYRNSNTIAPLNTTYGESAPLTATTTEDAGGSGKFYAKFCDVNNDVAIPYSADVKVYAVYVDEGTAYFRSLRNKNGFYEVAANDHVIIKTNEQKTVNIEYLGSSGSIAHNDDDDIFSVIAKCTVTEFQADAIQTTPTNVQVNAAALPRVYNFSKDGGSNYIYRLTNNKNSGGFGFTYFTGTNMTPGQFFIESNIAPAASGRLNMIWLDEDGNVESDATAIETVKTVENEGAIYNLAGQKVDANFKGVVIKNGKKMIQK